MKSNDNYWKESIRGDSPHLKHLNPDHYEDEGSPLRTFLTTAAVGVAGVMGTRMAFKHGLLQDMSKSFLKAMAQYRPTEADAIFSSLKQWTTQEMPWDKYGTMKEKFFTPNVGIFSGGATEAFKQLERRINATKAGQQSRGISGRSALITDELDIERAIRHAEFSRTRIEDYANKVQDTAQHDFAKRKIDEFMKGYNVYSKNQRAADIQQYGMRRATVGDIYNYKNTNGQLYDRHPETKRQSLVEFANRNFSKDPSNPGEFMERMADPWVFTDGAGELYDLRYWPKTWKSMLDSAEKDFGLPFVNFNPLAMFHVGDYLNVRHTPKIHAMAPTEVQPFLNGREATDKTYLFLGDSVYDVANKVETPIDKGYLINAQGGPARQFAQDITGAGQPKPSDYHYYSDPLGSAWGKFTRTLDIGHMLRQDQQKGDNFEITNILTDVIAWPVEKFWQKFKPYKNKDIHSPTPFGTTFDKPGSDYAEPQLLFMRSARLEDPLDFVKQVFASRDRNEDITGASVPLYYFFSRLDAALASFGLGLSAEHRKSGGDIFLNMLLRRALPVYAGVEAWKYANYESEELTGARPDEVLADVYTGLSTMAAGVRDEVGITEWAKHVENLFPGGEQISELPLIGRIFDLDDSKEETEEYWEEGEDPIRKGRWWFMGNCVHPDTPIQLADGILLPAKDVQAGHSVLTHTGEPQKVLRVITRQMNDDEWTPEITVHGFPESIITTDNHPYLAVKKVSCPSSSYDNCRPDRPCNLKKSYKQCDKRSEWKALWTMARHIEPGDFLAYPRFKFKDLVVGINGIPLNDETGYLIGVFLAEGHINKWDNSKGYQVETTHNITELEITEELERIVNKYFGTSGKTRVVGKGKTLKYRVCSRKMTRWIQDLLYQGREKLFPGNIQDYPEEFAIGLLRGMFDGDGHIAKAGSDSLGMFLTANRMNHIIGIRNLLFAFGIPNTIGRHDNDANAVKKVNGRCQANKVYQGYRIFVTGDAAKVLYKLIDYRKPCTTSLKLTGIVDKNIYIDEDYVYLKVKSVKDSSYRGVVYDFEIEEAHSFCGLTVILHNTPFTGARTMYYAPNWARRTKSHYEFTDTQYGSESEYFANAAYPTLRYPMAPIRHFITDPYHWERKQYEDRPYLLTGGIPELEEIPLLGPLINATIGQLFKPQVEMHPEAWQGVNRVADDNTSYAAAVGGVVGHGEGGSYQQIGEGNYEGPITVRPSGTQEAAGIVIAGPGNGSILNEEGKEVKNPGDASVVGHQVWENLKEFGGFYGFSTELLYNTSNSLEPQIATSRGMISPRREFWDLELGGMPGDINEIARRFVGHREKWENRFNPIENKMPDWMPGPEYFQDFQHGDPYIKLRRGEMRLPGNSYEALHPDTKAAVDAALEDPETRARLEAGEITRTDLYDPMSRFRILADVAPWSQQFDETSKYITAMKKTKEQEDEVREIRKQVKDRNDQIRLYPYRFKNAETKKETVTVTKVLDDWADSHNYMFYTKEHPDNPIKLAGLRVPMGKNDPDARGYLSQFVKPGAEVEVEYTADDIHQINDDTYKTISAVVYSDDTNLNRELINKEIVKEDDDDYSPAGIAARFTFVEQMAGRAWETIAHTDSPLNTKMLQVRSAQESYFRRDLYGKDWQEWQDPIEDFAIPWYEQWMSRGPIGGLVSGAAIGFLMGRPSHAQGRAKRLWSFGRIMGTMIGGMIGGSGGTYYSAHNALTGETWVPERRKEEWAINEYYDVLKYLKNQSLYQQYTKASLEEDKFDVNQYLKEQGAKKDEDRQRIYELEDAKRAIKATVGNIDIEDWIEKLNLTDNAEDDRELVKLINKELTELRAPKKDESSELPENARRAIEYLNESRKTMYGHRPQDPLTDLLSAIPMKERKYLEGFMNATPEEREKLRDTMSPYMQRIVRPAWGDKDVERPTLMEYFKDRFLPDPEWAGWREDVNIDNVKVKYINAESMDTSEFNVWPDDIERSRQSDVPPAPKLDVVESAHIVKQKLETILAGAGVDAEVSVEAGGEGLQVDVDVERDYREQINQYLNNYGSLVIGG